MSLKPEQFIDKYKALLSKDQCDGLRYYLNISDTTMLVGRGIGINRRIARIIRSKFYTQLETNINIDDYINKLLEFAAINIMKDIKLVCDSRELYLDLRSVISRYMSFPADNSHSHSRKLQLVKLP